MVDFCEKTDDLLAYGVRNAIYNRTSYFSICKLTHTAPFWQHDVSALRQTALWEEVILFSVYVFGKIRLTALLNSLTLCAPSV